MKKNIKKNLLSTVVAAILLFTIISISEQLQWFDSVESVVSKISISGEMIIDIVVVVSIVVLITNVILMILGIFSGKKGRAATLATVVSSLVKYAAVLLGCCWVLTIIGVNISTIFASVGIVALILGFGAESLVADIITGVFILFENQYNVGDIVEIDGFRGKVKEIGIRTLSLEDSGGNIKIINNSDLKNIVNRSNQKSVAICDVSIPYDTNLEEFEKKISGILTDIKEKNKDVFIDRVEFVGVEALADSGVVVRIIADVSEEDIFSGRRLLNKEIKIAFDKAKIAIPFPQIDVHNK